MPPTLILIRHAEALHNVGEGEERFNQPDPVLTERGKMYQCKWLRESLMEHPIAQQAGLIVASPLRRTLQTAHLAAGWLMEKGIKVQADADWQENSSKPCDTGSPVAVVSQEFPEVDFTTVDPVFPDKTSPAGSRYYYTRSAILARGQHALRKLYDRPEKVIIVVSHSGFLRLGVSGCWYMNADYRIFDFEESTEAPGELRLVEHADTREKGGGLGVSWTERVPLGGVPGQLPVML